MITENDSFTTLLLLALRPSPSAMLHGLDDVDVQFSSALPGITRVERKLKFTLDSLS